MAVSARPSFPTTKSIRGSGHRHIHCWSNCLSQARPNEAWVVGINRKGTLFREGWFLFPILGSYESCLDQESCRTEIPNYNDRQSLENTRKHGSNPSQIVSPVLISNRRNQEICLYYLDTKEDGELVPKIIWRRNNTSDDQCDKDLSLKKKEKKKKKLADIRSLAESLVMVSNQKWLSL